MIAWALGFAAAASSALPTLPSLLEEVRRGDAGAAYARLATAIDAGELSLSQPRAALLADVLRHLRCAELAPFPSLPASASAAERLARELLDVEKERVQRMRRAQREAEPEQWIADGRLRWTMPAPTFDANAIRWPTEEERWSDETPIVPAPEVLCPRASATAAAAATGAGTPSTGEAAGGEEAAVTPRLDEERGKLTHEAETVRALRLRLPASEPVRAALLLDEEVVRARLGAWPEVWALVRLSDGGTQPGAVPGPADATANHTAPPTVIAAPQPLAQADLTPRERAQSAILGALAAEEDHQDADALARWDRAAQLPLTDEEKLFVDLHRQRWLVSLGHFAEARALLDRRAELAGPVGDYLRYRMALVRFRMGDEAGLLAIARATLGHRSAAEVARNPVAQGVLELALLQLARHPFGSAEVEVMESLGVVRELYLRLEQLGAVALERGRPKLAVDVFGWLLEHYRLPFARPAYLGRLAAAAAADGDAAAFTRSFGALVDETLAQIPRPPSTTPTAKAPAATASASKPGKGKPQPPPPPSLLTAPRARRPPARSRRSIEWDRQILLATRDAVTPLIARHDDASLRFLVDKLQVYLRIVGERQTYAELSDLYRMASKQLPPSPRAYAEKVGAERQPVWLGEVTLDRVTVVVPEPALATPALEGPVTLLCLPDASGPRCPRWLGPPPPTTTKPTEKAATKPPRATGSDHAR